MISIIFYAFATIFILFYSGYGLGYLLTPTDLKKYSLWLSPWYAAVILIFSLVVFGLMGFTISQTILPLFVVISLTNFYVLIKKRTTFAINLKEDLIIGIIIVISIFFNLSPLFKYYRYPTSLSMGNNDVINYAVTSDYLLNHSIADSFKSKMPAGVDDLLVGGYRWGPPIIISFFQTIFNLQAYQYISIFQSVIFSLMLPLGYILAKIIFKPSLICLLLILVITALNVNLLYILYHGFLGQILYWGLQLFILIFLFTYLFGKKTKNHQLNLFDIILGISITVLFFSYHEGVIFIILPVSLAVTIESIRTKSIHNLILVAKIILVSILTGFSYIIHALVTDYGQAFGGDPNQPIGWQVFRNNIPFANPFEMIGLYSIHSSEPLPLIIAVILSIGVIAVIFFGLFKSKKRPLLLSYIAIYTLFLFLYSLIRPNFWVYNRGLTYNLPLILILFSIGITCIVQNRTLLKKYILVGIIILELFSATELNKRFLREHLVVDKSFISLKELHTSNSFSEPVYMEGVLDDTIPLWKQIWTSYFLYNGNTLSPSTFVMIPFENRITDNSLILLSKPTPLLKPPQVLLKSPIVWENQYYILGRLCNSSECLLNRSEDLSGISMGKDTFEDSLLISGWSMKESTNRWATGKESTLRLVAKDSGFNQLSFEAQTLKEPQTVTVYFDGKLLGTTPVSSEWQRYSLSTGESIQRGVHQIRLIYSNTYKPSEVLKSQDTRELAVNFRWIGLTNN